MTTPQMPPPPATPQSPAVSPIVSHVPEAVLVACLLLPGFISERVAAYFTAFPPQSDAELVASALAFTLLDILLSLALLWIVRTGLRLLRFLYLGLRNRRFIPPSWPSLYDTSGGFIATFALALLLTSITAGRVWALAEESNIVFRMTGSSRESRSDIWYTTFHDNALRSNEDDNAFLRDLHDRCIDARAPNPKQEFFVPKPVRHVRVLTTSGEVYQGVPERFSGNGTERWVYIARSRVDLLHKQGDTWHAECVKGPPGVLLNANQIQAVEWLERPPATPASAASASRAASPMAFVLNRGESYTCQTLRAEKARLGRIDLASYEMPKCAARVPLSVITGKDK